jgi:hypothetical protein
MTFKSVQSSQGAIFQIFMKDKKHLPIFRKFPLNTCVTEQFRFRKFSKYNSASFRKLPLNPCSLAKVLFFKYL